MLNWYVRSNWCLSGAKIKLLNLYILFSRRRVGMRESSGMNIPDYFKVDSLDMTALKEN